MALTLSDIETECDIIVNKFIGTRLGRFSTYFEVDGQYYEVVVQKLSKAQVKRREDD